MDIPVKKRRARLSIDYNENTEQLIVNTFKANCILENQHFRTVILQLMSTWNRLKRNGGMINE